MPEPSFDVSPSVGNHFAWMRTLIALQRTLMAAVRTAVSLIGFGFTVAQFFQKMAVKGPSQFDMVNPAMPRNVGLILIGTGVISLLIFTIQYHQAVRYLRSEPFAPIAGTGGSYMHQPTYLVAYAVMFIGVISFGSVFLRF
ncbi:DUF202 domain-containing protein [Sphingomonas sp. SM33]|uniref:DUF202 domain-containing protein n=1 Tax=Sphingomonas telluris TaxID=2907998 RepID=A0ABS9VNH9_9SPHN|nr:DUF202 domain-containing protein [Sphingomonas telluris]MCH8616512.1 DUF202 domain-containing protein [Sphingomonas telluris]